MKTEHYKEVLEKEKEELIKQLSGIGSKNPKNDVDWIATPEKLNNEKSDLNDVADNVEKYEINHAVVSELEIRLNNIKDALKRIEDGTYGVCKISGEQIEKDRLEANPAAETCKGHINE